MKWLGGESTGSGEILIIEDDQELAEEIRAILTKPCSALLLSKEDRLPDVLQTLYEHSEKTQAVFIAARLVYKDCPEPADSGGIELYKHLRLTPALGRLSLLPILVYGVEPVEWHLRRAPPDNVILLAPRCEYLQMPASLSAFREAVHQPCFCSEHQLRQDLRPFVIGTEPEKRFHRHVYLNKSGLIKFLTEFAVPTIENDNPVLKRARDEIQSDLWFKKQVFCSVGYENSHDVLKEPSEGEEFWNTCEGQQDQPHRFLYIDDEHRQGWSFGLYAGLFGDQLDAQFFEHNQSRLETADHRLLCISSYPDATKFFEDQARELEDALARWVKAEFEENKAETTEAECQLNHVFRYSLAFQDLRLEQSGDETRPTDELTGIQLLTLIQSLFPELPVIVMTASEMAVNSEKVRQLGADAYWIKGVCTGTKLREAVRRALMRADLLPISRRIRQVESKHELHLYTWVSDDKEVSTKKERRNKQGRESGKEPPQGAFLPRALGKQAPDRTLIVHLLKDAFAMLRSASGRLDYFSYNRVVIHCGIIQELRYRGSFDANWRCLPTAIGNPCLNLERTLRRRRNHLLHPEAGHQSAIREEALKWFKFTVDRLLRSTWQ